MKIPASLTIFPRLVLVSNPKIYQNDTFVELYAAFHPGARPFKLVWRGQPSEITQFPSKFKAGDTVRVHASVEPYKGRVYGKMGRALKYPDGSLRSITKNRFHIIKIRKGVGKYFSLVSRLLEELRNG